MHKVWKIRTAMVCTLALAGLMFVASSTQVEARPNYNSAFKTQYKETKNYKELEKAHKKVKCNLCHFGSGKDSKKNRNDYGKALEKALGKAKVKDKEVIAKALKKIEKEKSKTKDKTFVDLINEGKLPGTAPKKKE